MWQKFAVAYAPENVCHKTRKLYSGYRHSPYRGPVASCGRNEVGHAALPGHRPAESIRGSGVTEHHTAAVKPFGSREAGTEGHNHQTQDSGNTKISDTTACLAASASTTTGLSLDRLRAPVKTGTLHGHLA